MLVDSPTQGNLLPILSTSRASQLKFGHISLHSNNLCAGSSRPDVDHKDLVLGKFGDLSLLSVRSLDTEKTTQ